MLLKQQQSITTTTITTTTVATTIDNNHVYYLMIQGCLLMLPVVYHCVKAEWGFWCEWQVNAVDCRRIPAIDAAFPSDRLSNLQQDRVKTADSSFGQRKPLLSAINVFLGASNLEGEARVWFDAASALIGTQDALPCTRNSQRTIRSLGQPNESPKLVIWSNQPNKLNGHHPSLFFMLPHLPGILDITPS